LGVLATACDYSSFLPDYDIPDVTVSDIPFDPPDDWVPSDDGQPGFIITNASPLVGPSTGGTRVTIEGRGFTSGSTVLFGPSEGLETIVESEYTIRTTSPVWSGYSETVDLWVVRGDGKKSVMRPGFRYQSDVAVASVLPLEGPVAGGTPVTVRGHGFAPDADLIIDGRSALAVQRLDDSTIMALTPPGDAGDVDVLVLSGNSSGRLGRGFSYVNAPDGATCAPSVVDMAGSDGSRIVEFEVSGLFLDDVRSVSLSSGRVTSFRLSDADTLVVGVDYSGVTATGPVDLTLSGPGGIFTADGCFTALEREQIDDERLHIHAFSPGSVPVEGGVVGTLTVTGLDTGNPSVLLARVGSSPVAITEVPDMNTVRFLVPPGSPGRPDIVLETPAETAQIKDAFTYLRSASVTGVDPAIAPPEGGTTAAVVGTWLADATEVLVGPLPAAITGKPSDKAIPIVIPAVGPGVHDVTVTFADGGRVTAPAAVTCTADGVEIKAVSPDRGSLAGGTAVYVTGAGLKPGTRVFFDRWEAPVVDDTDPGRLTVRTPAGDKEGTVDVFVVGEDGIRHTLKDAFTYFNPTGFLGGTWGPEISGSLNVTVIDSYNDTPIPQAFVMVGSNPDTPFKGFTDGRGMITLSGRNLSGPVMVTATRQDYTTWSVAGFDAENVTVYLEPLFTQIPPDTGNGGEDNEFPLTPGLVSGRVTGTDKEFMVPPVSCAGIPAAGGTMCLPCDADEDCGAESLCVMTGSTALTCSRPCLVREDCPDGWDCYQAADQGTVCKPGPGVEEVRCGVADATSTRWSDSFGPGAVMTASGTYALNSRLGDVAIYCLGGFRRYGDGVFVPVIMGLNRHVSVTTSTINQNNDVRLNIPLDRTLRLRMIAAPGGRGGPTDHTGSMTVYLGSDGYLNLWSPLTGTDRAIFDFEHLPAAFDGAMEGAELFMSAQAESPNDSGDPYSVVYPRMWKPWTPGAFQVLDDGTVTASETIALEALSSCSSDHGAVVIDTSHRAWLIDDNGNITALPSIGHSDIAACAWTDDGRVIFTGARSAVYTWNPSDMSVSVESAGDAYPTLDVARTCGDNLWVAGHGRLWAKSGDGEFRQVPYGSPAPVKDLECLNDSTVVGTGDAGTLFVADVSAGRLIPLRGVAVDLHSAVVVDGRIVITGSRGTMLAGPNPDELRPLDTGILDDLTVSTGLTGGRVLVGGSRGILALLDGDNLTIIRKPSEQAEFSAFAAVTAGGVASGGAVLAFRRASIMAGPFVNIPKFSSPPDNWLWLDRDISWGIETPPQPSFYYLRMYTVGAGGRWSIIADGRLRSIELPDVATASGQPLKPIKPGTVSLWTYTVISPGFDIDNYDSTSLYTSKWDAWSAIGILTKMF